MLTAAFRRLNTVSSLQALVEQVTWSPFAYTQFYLCINLMEGKSWDECEQQWRTKVPQTWKVKPSFLCLTLLIIACWLFTLTGKTSLTSFPILSI